MRSKRIPGGLLTAVLLAVVTSCSTSGSGQGRPESESEPEPESATERAKQPAAAPRPVETFRPLFEQALPNVEGKTFTSAVVDFPAHALAKSHRHGEAFVYAQVLEGSVRSQVAGTSARTYRKGEFWVEQPGAHHVLTENVSRTEPARLLVVFVSDTGDALKVNDPESWYSSRRS